MNTTTVTRPFNQTLIVFTREFGSLFLAPSTYVIPFGFLLLQASSFSAALQLSQGAINDVVMRVFGQEIFWFLIIMVPPLLTMRTIAEEKRTGTYELLVTSGTPEGAIVVGKYLASWLYFSILWATVLPLFWTLSLHGDVEWGVIRSCYLGTVAIGSMFCAFGVFGSACTSNPLVAAIIAVSLGIAAFFVNTLRAFFEVVDTERYFFDYLSPVHHFTQDFRFGIVDLRYLALYASVALFSLFVATKVLERRRWW